MTLGLFTVVPLAVNGLTKVAINLIRGLRQAGIEIDLNQVREKTACLQSMVPEFPYLPPTTLIGPTHVQVPSEMPWIWDRYRHFLMPSEWIKRYFETDPLTKNANLIVWPVGIDTDRFNDQHRNIKRDCFVYFKNRPEDHLPPVTEYLNKKGLTFEVIKYGSYKEGDLTELCKTSRFCILNTAVETQGIAYMEILSQGVPCLPLSWNDKPNDFGVPTPVPYFNNECGLFAMTIDDGTLERFIDLLPSFNPRKYILENHTLKASAIEYMKIVDRVFS